jgi:hypothetical protein
MNAGSANRCFYVIEKLAFSYFDKINMHYIQYANIMTQIYERRSTEYLVLICMD